MFSALKGLYNSLWLQRLLTLISVVVMLWMLSGQMGEHGWWVAVVAVLVLLLEYLAFYRGVEYGIRTYYNMPKQKQQQLIKLLEPEDDNNDYTQM